MHQYIIIIVCLTGVLRSPPAAVATEDYADPTFVALTHGNPGQVEKAMSEVRHLLVTPPLAPGSDPRWRAYNELVFHVREEWVPELIRRQRFEIAAELAQMAVLAAPNLQNINQLVSARTHALRALGRHDQALASAKSYYNACSLHNTPRAIDIVAETLAAARPDDPAAGTRFKLEQLDGAEFPAGDDAEGAPNPAAAAGRPDASLAGITVDPTPYLQALPNVSGTGYHAYFKRGNLLLLADRPVEARQERSNARRLATEGIARAIRAEDGSVGRANAWIEAHQAGSTGTPE